MEKKRKLWLRVVVDSEKLPLLHKALEELGTDYLLLRSYSDKFPFFAFPECRELAHLIFELKEDVEIARTEARHWREEIRYYHEQNKELKELILHLITSPSLLNGDRPVQRISQARETISKDEALARVLKADTLLVLDKYLLDAGKMNEEEYAKELSRWLDFREGKKVKLVVSVQGKKRQCVLKLLADEAKNKGAVLEIADGSKYGWQHDRFWVDEDSKEAFVIGTSINGLWKHLSVILPLNPEDTETLLHFIENHARFEFKRAEQFITDCNSLSKQSGR